MLKKHNEKQKDLLTIKTGKKNERGNQKLNKQSTQQKTRFWGRLTEGTNLLSLMKEKNLVVHWLRIHLAMQGIPV